MKITDWKKCHGQGWGDLLVPEAYGHPAKVSRALARRIYTHVVEEGWLKLGDYCLDPFAGIGGFALHALQHGLNWIGVELEQKFVDLGQQNIDMWNSRYKGKLPRWGSAVLLQGDSRNLAEVLGQAELNGCISSPPFLTTTCEKKRNDEFIKKWQEKHGRRIKGGPIAFDGQNYGSHPAQLGNMPVGNPPRVKNESLDGCIASPPYQSVLACDERQPIQPRSWDVRKSARVKTHQGDYGSHPAQLGNMPAGDPPRVKNESLDGCISSPPYASAVNPHGEGPGMAGNERQRKRIEEGSETERAAQSRGRGYGQTEGQLAAMPLTRKSRTMPEGEISACISSPPFGGSELSTDEKFRANMENPGRNWSSGAYTKGNMALEQNATFWSAARTILQQVYSVLKPGAPAIWVVKRFVRAKQIVEFSQQWCQLCESVGFKLVHWHRAWLVEDDGTQMALIGDDKRMIKKRFSFFRRLHARKYPHLEISWEDVLCMKKPQ